MSGVVLCRPLGGLNDTLCRIAVCLRFAEKTGRNLIIDTRDSGLMGEFDGYLVFRQDSTSVSVTTKVDDDLLHSLNGLSAYPRFLNHEVSLVEFMSLTPKARREVAQSKGLTSLRTDLGGDYGEDLVFYEGAGGGTQSFSVLSHLSVSDSILDRLNVLANNLPPRYLGAHVRATDYRADADYFLGRLSKIRPGTPVYLATDNQAVYEKAQARYLSSRLLGALPRSPIEPHQPKHMRSNYQSQEELRTASEQVFCDLFALAGSSRLYYPLLDPSTTEHGLPKASGFSRLARYLVENPLLFDTFFRTSRPTPPPRWAKARILAPLSARWLYWKGQPFRHLPKSLRPRGRVKALLGRWRGIETV